MSKLNQLLARVQRLERELGVGEELPRLFITIVHAGRREDGTVCAVPLETLGFRAGPSAQGPEVEVLRQPGESMEALEARCARDFPSYVVWMPIRGAA